MLLSWEAILHLPMFEHSGLWKVCMIADHGSAFAVKSTCPCGGSILSSDPSLISHPPKMKTTNLYLPLGGLYMQTSEYIYEFTRSIQDMCVLTRVQIGS